MFRRSRFSIRPNVGTAGRTAATPQEAPSANQEASETPKDVGESSTATAVTDNKSVVTLSDKPTDSGDGNDQNGEGTSSSAAVQRRKRFSIKPKVAPGRPPTLARTPKSPAKAVSETPIEVPVSDLDKPTTSSQTASTAAPQRLQSPRRRRPSEESKQPKIQPKPTIIPSESSEPSALSAVEDPLKQTQLPTDSGKELESTLGSQVKEVPSRLPDKVPPSLPDKEAIEISEKAKTLVSSKSGLSLSPPAFSLSRLLNDPSDLQRLAKAEKLRELLKQEMNKEKKIKKAKARVKEYTLDPAKMTMRDLIRYLPLSNPMTSSLEESAQENETVVPPSPVREESPETAQQPEVPPKIASPREEEEAEAEAEAEEEQDEGIMVPQVKVAEDGSLIIDEESLTVEVQRTKGPNPAQDRDPIFERGSTTTYSSFRKGTYSKPWSSEETDMFFLAISMVGTDFSMICQLFTHRARSEIKNKFKKEERENAWRIDKAFRERRKLDIEYFSKLLEKILEVQKNRKKLKSLAGKKSTKKHKRKANDKKAARKLSVVEEEDEEEQTEIPDLEEEEREKENEDLCNEGGSTVAKPKKKRKRKNRQDASTEEPNDKKNKTGEKSNEQDEACIPEDAEAALPEDCPNSNISEKTENVNAAKDTTIKPAKLSRGRAPKPLLSLGRKWGKKPPPPSTKASDTASDKGGESVMDGASEEQVNKDASPIRQANKRKSASDDISSEEEDATVQPLRPTRYGRVPKPTKPLNYPAKEAAHSSPASPAGSTASAARPKPKSTVKRGRSSKPQSAQESKKPKLVTLRASQSEYSDEEDEKQREEEEEEEEHHACSSSKDSTAPVFVPASLRSPHPVISEVEETMEELDILANMPDVLGISQDALCPDDSCERAQNETGTAEPCEHQLDLLVDVIDFLSSEHTEASEEESYNEAAQTLLTIGNLAHLSQAAPNQITIQDHITVAGTSVSVNETTQHLQGEIALMSAAHEEKSATTLMSETSGHGVTETTETVTIVDPQNNTTDDDVPIIKSCDQMTGSDMDPTPQLHSSPESPEKNSPQSRKGCLPKVKPKPNLGQASRTVQSQSQPDTSTVQRAEESQTVVPDFSQTTETLSAAEETPKISECSQQLLNEISCIEHKLTEEPTGNQETSVGQVKSGAATSYQSASGNQNFSEAQFEASREQATRDTTPTSESTDEKLMSYVGTAESSCNNLLTSPTAVTESQVGQGSNLDSVPVQESSNRPAPCVTPLVEELSVSQKEESEIGSTCQPRRGRLQKVKPKPKLPPRALRSKPQTTKDPVIPMQLAEKPSSPTSRSESTTNTITEVEAKPTFDTSPSKKPSQVKNMGTASVSVPSLKVCSTHDPTEELSTAEEKKTDVGVVFQLESGTATSDQSVLENQNFSDAQFEARKEQATGDTTATLESTDEKLMSHVGTTESSCTSQLTFDSAVTESQHRQGFSIDSAPVQESSDHPASCVTPVKELPVSQKEESEVSSRKAKLWSTPTPTEELSTTEDKKTGVGVVGQVESGAVTSYQNASGNQNFSEAQFEASREQATGDTTPTSESTDEKLMSYVGTAESSGNNLLTSPTAVTESQVGQGSNVDSVFVKHSSVHPVSCIAPVEELPVSQKKESEVASTRQTRKSRFQKDIPNLAQTSRTVRSKPHTTKDTVEKESDPTPNPKFHEKTIEKIEAEPICTTSPEKPSQSHGRASDLIPSLDLGSTLTPTEGLYTTGHKKNDVGVVGQAESGGAASDQRVSGLRLDQSASGNQNFSEAQFEPSGEQATRDTMPTLDEKLISHVGTVEGSCNYPLTSDSAVTESQVGQGFNIDSAPVEESSDYPASCVTPVEELPVSQKEGSEISSTRQTRKSRFQKVIPNLAQTSRTVRSKPHATKDTTEKDSNPSPNPKFHEKTIEEVEAQSTCTTSPEKCSQSRGPALDLVPSLDLGSTFTPTEELSTTEDKKIDVGVIGQVESGGATSDQRVSGLRLDQSASGNQNFSEAQFEPSGEQATRETSPMGEKLMSHVGTAKSSCNSSLTFDTAVTESQVYQSKIDSVNVQESSVHPASCVTPAEELPVSQREESKAESTCQTRGGWLQKAKPKPNLPPRTERSKPQTTKDPVTPIKLVEKTCSPTSRPESTNNTIVEVEAKQSCSITSLEKPSLIKSTGTASVLVPSLEVCTTHKTTEEFSSGEEQKTDVGCGRDSNSEGSEQNVPRRRRFLKVKPNLGSSPRTKRTKLLSNDISKPSEKCHMDVSLTSEQQPVVSTNDKGTSSDGIVMATSWVAENQVLTDSVLENKSREKSAVEEESTGDKTSNNEKVEAGPASQWDSKQDMSIRDVETSIQSTDDPTAVSDVQSSEDGLTESKTEYMLHTNTQSTPSPKEGAQQPRSEIDSEAQSQDAVQQYSETTETKQTAAQSTDNNQSEPTSSPSRKAPQTRRGRLIKPKPTLGRSSRPRQPQQLQNAKQSEADFGTHSEGVDASVCNRPVSEQRPDIQEPVEGAIEQCSNPNSPQNNAGSSPGCLTQVIEQLSQDNLPPAVAGSSLGCVTQAPDSCTQDASTSSTGGTQSYASLTIFPDMLSQQEPSDPDEPYFILSLTEIPVCSSGEVVGSVPEPLPYLPVTYASSEQQSVPGGSSAAAGDRPPSTAAVPVPMEDSGETGLISVINIGPEPAAHIASVLENPVDPHESTPVHPSKLPETVENNDETEIPPTKQRLISIRRRGSARQQVKPSTTKRKQASKTLAAKETESIPVQTNITQNSELPGPSVQPKAFDDIVTEPQKGSGDHVDAEKETVTGGEEPEDSSSGAPNRRTRGTSSRNRKPKGFLSETKSTAPSNDSPPGKAASKGLKVKTPRAAGKKSTTASIASTSHDVAPTPNPTQPTEVAHSTSSTASPTQTGQTSEHRRLCSVTTPSTPPCPAEVSASQQSVESSSVEEEEPTSVSQYFLSDIFTEVEDG